MNERIKSLIERAEYQAKKQSGYEDWEVYVTPDSQVVFEKFAELIVRECGQWFNDRLVVEPDYGLEHRVERNRVVSGVMKEFNQHFGMNPNEITTAMLDRTINQCEQQLAENKND